MLFMDQIYLNHLINGCANRCCLSWVTSHMPYSKSHRKRIFDDQNVFNLCSKFITQKIKSEETFKNLGNRYFFQFYRR